MFRQVLVFLILCCCAVGVLGDELGCLLPSQDDCLKQILWIWYVTIDTPFRKARELLLRVSGEVEKMKQRKQKIEDSLKSLSAIRRDLGNVSEFELQLKKQLEALSDAVKIYEKLEKNVTEKIKVMESTTKSEDHTIGVINSAAGTVWSLGGSYGGDFSDLRKSFEKIRENSDARNFEKCANEVVDQAVRSSVDSSSLNKTLIALLDSVTARYKGRMNGIGESLLNNPQEWVKDVVREFVDNWESIRNYTEVEEGERQNKEKIQKVDCGDKDIKRRVAQILEDVQSRHCSKFQSWLDLRRTVNEEAQEQESEVRAVFEEMRLVESDLPFSQIGRVGAKIVGGPTSEENTWVDVMKASESFRLSGMYNANVLLTEQERKDQFRWLLGNASGKKHKDAGSGEEYERCEALRMEQLLMEKIATSMVEQVIGNGRSVCGNPPPVCNVSDTEGLLKEALQLMNSSAEDSSIVSAIHVENSTWEKRRNAAAQLLERGRGVLEMYKKRIVKDISNVWNGTCGVQQNVGKKHLKVRELKKRLQSLKGKIKRLRDGAYMQENYESDEANPVAHGTHDWNGLLVRKGERARRSIGVLGGPVNVNVSLRIRTLLEQAERADSEGLWTSGCAVVDTAVFSASHNTSQLIANLTGEIQVYDVLVHVNESVASQVEVLEGIVVGLQKATAEMEEENKEAAAKAACEPMWKQMLRMVLG
ncbi:hypothetical protein, conserved in T. vivax [Trypanosoma vivax Y486]|uniref:Uncharacterized protein n=1 Tax=Trypanosoma vivax (strain Y486) TaxID=1055687 RepID=F9WSV3_TRYVY|nr:hypothetical protein, conserved in T. vivax [Trypanosoma vivax Y486]|eukprot:CCD20642.1 hypothetical protein, conserved in T. vivax [Trypanosoma vivax Y486]